MADHVLDRGRLAEAVGDDIADMAQFWMLRKFQFLESARTQFEVIVDPWLSYCEEPSQNEIMAYNMAFTDWLLFERPYYHGKTLLELYADEPPASLSPASLGRLEPRCATRSIFRALVFWTKILRLVWSRCATRAPTVVLMSTTHISCKKSAGAMVRLRCASRALTIFG